MPATPPSYPPSRPISWRFNTASSRSFTLAKAGLVAICYEWVPFSASSNLYLSVDGLEVQHHMAGQEGTGSHVYTRYVFLRAGKHTLGFSTGGDGSWVQCVSAGLHVVQPALSRPIIARLSPTSGRITSVVTIWGTHFGARRGRSMAEFGSRVVTRYLSSEPDPNQGRGP